MALRIRKNRKEIVCAAESIELIGDCYLNDEIHYVLSAEMKILHTDDDGKTWYFDTNKLKEQEKGGEGKIAAQV